MKALTCTCARHQDGQILWLRKPCFVLTHATAFIKLTHAKARSTHQSYYWAPLCIPITVGYTLPSTSLLWCSSLTLWPEQYWLNLALDTDPRSPEFEGPTFPRQPLSQRLKQPLLLLRRQLWIALGTYVAPPPIVFVRTVVILTRVSFVNKFEGDCVASLATSIATLFSSPRSWFFPCVAIKEPRREMIVDPPSLSFFPRRSNHADLISESAGCRINLNWVAYWRTAPEKNQKQLNLGNAHASTLHHDLKRAYETERNYNSNACASHVTTESKQAVDGNIPF